MICYYCKLLTWIITPRNVCLQSFMWFCSLLFVTSYYQCPRLKFRLNCAVWLLSSIVLVAPIYIQFLWSAFVGDPLSHNFSLTKETLFLYIQQELLMNMTSQDSLMIKYNFILPLYLFIALISCCLFCWMLPCWRIHAKVVTFINSCSRKCSIYAHVTLVHSWFCFMNFHYDSLLFLL